VYDALRLYVAAFARSAAAAVTGVLAAIALQDRGVPVHDAGQIIGAGLAGAALATALVGVYADRFGRRRTLVVLTVLSTCGYVGLASSGRAALLFPLAFAGMVNAMGRDRGAAAAVEQAVLPDITTPGRRTWAFAWYNVVMDGAQMFGSAGAALPAVLVAWRFTPVGANSAVFDACAAATLLTIPLYATLSPNLERRQSKEKRRLSAATRPILARLSILFGLDALGSGFLNSALLAYWFFERFHLTHVQVALLFAAARGLNSLSHLVAAWLARRIGLVKTMVGTHIPSSVLLILVPAAPTAAGAAALFLAREALVEMDVPTRQSYVMAIVPATDRALVSGATSVVRLAGWALGPIVAGFLLRDPQGGLPIVIGGLLKIVYDVMLYLSFRHVRPPEERSSG
jgi:MFS family permease